MRNWKLKSVYSIYKLIDEGSKTIDTRVPDFKNRDKRFERIAPGDCIDFICVDDIKHVEMDFPMLRYVVIDSNYFLSKGLEDNIERIVKRMFKEIPIEKVFPGHNINEAIKIYRGFHDYEKNIIKYGINSFEISKRL